MMGLKMLTIVNNDPGDGEGHDYVNSWNPANYADPIDLTNPDWQCGIQPWSRGPRGSNKPITEREWQWYLNSTRRTDSGLLVNRNARMSNILKHMRRYGLGLGFKLATMLSNSTESKQ